MRLADLKKRVIGIQRTGKRARRDAHLEEGGIGSQPLENLLGDEAGRNFKIIARPMAQEQHREPHPQLVVT